MVRSTPPDRLLGKHRRATSQLAAARPKGQQGWGCSCQLYLAAPAAVDLVPARAGQGALGSEPDVAAKPSDSQAKRSLPWVGRRPSRLGRPGVLPGAKKKSESALGLWLRPGLGVAAARWQRAYAGLRAHGRVVQGCWQLGAVACRTSGAPPPRCCPARKVPAKRPLGGSGPLTSAPRRQPLTKALR
jgi:hypothetical protein